MAGRAQPPLAPQSGRVRPPPSVKATIRRISNARGRAIREAMGRGDPQLGWNDVQVIDDDLGRSGGGIARPGFEKLLAAICEGRVGAVLSAARLSRSLRDRISCTS